MAVVKATYRYAKMSPTKIRKFADLVRGKSAAQGVDALRFHPNRGAKMLLKTLQSAIANAEDRGARNAGQAKIVDCQIDGGPVMKRIQPRARGMAYPLLIRSSHISVGLEVFDLKEAE